MVGPFTRWVDRHQRACKYVHGLAFVPELLAFLVLFAAVSIIARFSAYILAIMSNSEGTQVPVNYVKQEHIAQVSRGESDAWLGISLIVLDLIYSIR